MANDNPNAQRSRSQGAKILAYLQQGHRLTPGKALKKWGCARLGARIFDLIEAGHDTICQRLVRVNTQHGTARVAEYWMSDRIRSRPKAKARKLRRGKAEQF